MADQLSLFPSDGQPTREAAALPGDIAALDEMFAAVQQFRDSGTYKRMLTFIARLPQYSAFNGCLLFVQNPGATYVATAGAWARRFGRTPKPDARPLLILAPMAPVLFVFDVAETRGRDLDPLLLEPEAVRGRPLREAYERTVENAALHGIAVRETPSSDPRVGQAVTLTYNTRKDHVDLGLTPDTGFLVVVDGAAGIEERYRNLAHGLGHVFCGHLGIDGKAWWQDRRGIDPALADIEAESVAFLVLHRKGLAAAASRFLNGYEENRRVLPAFSLNAAFHATQYIEDMAKSLWQFPRRKSRYL